MKWPAFASVLAFGILVSGCIFHKHKTPAAAPAPAAASVIVTPDTSLAASVILCNPAGRFVVLNFPVGRMPAAGQAFFLYRTGLKQGEVRISGPRDDNGHIVADIITGDARVGDEVRDR